MRGGRNFRYAVLLGEQRMALIDVFVYFLVVRNGDFVGCHYVVVCFYGNFFFIDRDVLGCKRVSVFVYALYRRITFFRTVVEGYALVFGIRNRNEIFRPHRFARICKAVGGIGVDRDLVTRQLD